MKKIFVLFLTLLILTPTFALSSAPSAALAASAAASARRARERREAHLINYHFNLGHTVTREEKHPSKDKAGNYYYSISFFEDQYYSCEEHIAYSTLVKTESRLMTAQEIKDYKALTSALIVIISALVIILVCVLILSVLVRISEKINLSKSGFFLKKIL